MLSNSRRKEINRLSAAYRRGVYTAEELIYLTRKLVSPDSLAEILASVPSDLAEPLRRNIAECPPLKGVGYWWSHPKERMSKYKRFPDPRRLVDSGWCADERPQIAAYLRSGWTYTQWRGMSYCRFQCGVPGYEMGTRCLSDGEWVWPEGLAHYVECHEVRLPDEFVESMRRRDWEVVPGPDPARRMTNGDPDCSFWMTWGARPMPSEARRVKE
jgi:hypothetical protein